MTPLSSGYQDLNLGPPAPKAGALPDCATSRRIRRSLCEGGNLFLHETPSLKLWRSMAVREGFEPSVHLSAYDGLANRWFQPLTHLTSIAFAYLSST